MAKENKQLIKTWEDRYQDYLNSGLSIHKWCTLNGIANSTFSYWVRKFKNIQVEKTTTDKNPNTQEISIQNPIHHWIKVANSSAALTEIVANKTDISNETASKVITIKFEDISIDVPSEFDSVHLKNVLEVIKNL